MGLAVSIGLASADIRFAGLPNVIVDYSDPAMHK